MKRGGFFVSKMGAWKVSRDLMGETWGFHSEKLGPNREYRRIYPSKYLGNLDFHGQDSTIQTGDFEPWDFLR